MGVFAWIRNLFLVSLVDCDLNFIIIVSCDRS